MTPSESQVRSAMIAFMEGTSLNLETGMMGKSWSRIQQSGMDLNREKLKGKMVDEILSSATCSDLSKRPVLAYRLASSTTLVKADSAWALCSRERNPSEKAESISSFFW